MGAEKKKFPKIRFEGFEGTWRIKKLGDIGSVKMCRRIFKDETVEKGIIPFYKIGTFGGTADAFISNELFNEYRSKYAYPSSGDILISAAGTIGRTVVYKGEDAYFQDSNIVWLDHDGTKLSNSFFYQVLQSISWNELEGSTIKRLYNSHLLGKEISLPNLKEQTQIGNFFQKMDEVIELQQKRLALTQDYKKSMLQKMFPQKGEKVPRVRFGGFSEDWKEQKLGNNTNLITKGTTPKINDNSGEINFIKVENLNNGSINPIYKTSEFEHDNYLKRSRLEYGDILFSIAGTLGRTAFVEKEILPANTNQALAIIRGYNFDAYFLITALSGNIVEEYIRKNPTIGAQPNLSLEQVRSLQILSPSLKEQTAIGNFFQKLDEKIEAESAKLEKLQAMKKAMLQRMFV